MDVAQIIEDLRCSPEKFPKKALQAALRHPSDVAPALIRLLEKTLSEARRGDLPLDASPLHALFLLAQLRESAAYPLVVRLFSLPGHLGTELIGDVYDHDLHRILASVSDRDTGPIERMIENRKASSLIRACAVEALATMVLEGLAGREQVVAFFRRLLGGGLERHAEEVWDEVVAAAARLHPGELIEGIRRAVADGVVAPDSIALHDAEEALTRDPAEVLARARAESPGLIDDAVGELEMWYESGAFEAFTETAELDEESGEDQEAPEGEPVETFRHDRPPPGRNDPCPCGSGKKHKKCCGRS